MSHSDPAIKVIYVLMTTRNLTGGRHRACPQPVVQPSRQRRLIPNSLVYFSVFVKFNPHSTRRFSGDVVRHILDLFPISVVLETSAACLPVLELLGADQAA